MIDWTKLGSEWGYEPQVLGPQGPTPAGKTSITKKPTTTTTNTGGTTVGNTFQYPSEWGTAGDTWSNMAKGTYSNTGMQWLNDWLGKGGAQGMLSGWADAYKPAMMDDWTNMTKEMAERAGVGGTRYSSGLQNSLTNYGSQLMNQFNRDYMGNMLGAGQSDVGAAGNLAGLGLGAAQTGAEGLLSLGGQKAQLPLQVESLLNSLAGGMSGDQQGWMQLMNYIINGTQNQQQQYTPSAFQSILKSLSGTLGNDLFNYMPSPDLPSIDASGNWMTR